MTEVRALTGIFFVVLAFCQASTPRICLASDTWTKSIRWGRPSAIASQSSVAAELHLSKTQVTDLNEALKDREKWTELSIEEDAISRLLNHSQMNRLRQIRRQYLGALILLDDQSNRDLELTNAQKEELKSVRVAEDARLRSMLSGIKFADLHDFRAYIVEFWRDNEDLLKILNAEQMRKFEKDLGEKFAGLDDIRS